MKDKDTKMLEEAYDNIQSSFDKMLNSREEEKYYKTSTKNYSDSEYLRIIWRMPIEKLELLIELLKIDRKTAIELGRGRSITKQLYKRDKLHFDSHLKWAKQTLKGRLIGDPIPTWLNDTSTN